MNWWQVTLRRFNVPLSIKMRHKKCSLMINSCHYSLKPFHIPSHVETINYAVFEYTKSLNGFNSHYQIPDIPYVLNRDDKINKLETIITYSSKPQPKNILLLFDTYANSTKATYRLDRRKEVSKMENKIMHSLQAMSTEELYQLALSLQKIAKKQHGSKFFKNISLLLSAECLDRSFSSSSTETLKMFSIVYELYGNTIQQKSIFEDYVSIFKDLITNASPLELFQIVHFLSIGKKKLKYNDIFYDSMKLLVPHLNELPFVCVGIACHAYYKVGPKEIAILHFLDIISNCLKNFMNDITEDISLLESSAITAIIKILRFYNHFNIEIISCIKNLLFKQQEGNLPTEIICHLIAYCSTLNYYDKTLFERCENLLYKRLSSPDKEVRIKDVSRVIWAFSQVSYPCQEEFYLLVVKALEESAYTSEFLIHGQHYVDCALGFEIMGYHPDILIKKIVNQSLFNTLKDHKHSRKISRFLLLFEASKDRLSLKAPWLDVPQNLIPYHTIKDEITHRPAIHQINKSLDKLGGMVCPFELKFLVPYINTCSLVVKKVMPENMDRLNEADRTILSKLNEIETKSLFEIEDEVSCVVNEPGRLIGREHFKRKLLLRDGWTIYPLTEKEISQCADDPLSLLALLLHKLSSKETWLLHKC